MQTKASDTAVEPDQRTLILTALPAEADAILARTALDEDPVVVVDGRHYYLGTLGGKKVVITMTGIGMKNSADTTESALTHFTADSGVCVDAVVFAGVAGGSGRTQIGDVAIPAQWTSDDGASWHAVDPDMRTAAETLAVELADTVSNAESACRNCRPLARLRFVDLKRTPQLHVGGDGASHDNNNGAAFPTIPLGGAVFGPQPLRAPDFSPMFTGNFFRAIGPFLVRGALRNITGFSTAPTSIVDAVDQETAAAQLVADAHGVPFLGIRGMSDGPGDPLNLPGYPFTFFVYKRIAADNAAIVTEVFLQQWDGAET
jgi:nucleoside phosphorylase